MLSPSDENRIIGFAEKARAYCLWSEKQPIEGNLGMYNAWQYLTELSITAMALPDLFDEDAPEPTRIDDAEYRSIYARFDELPLAGYWDVFNPLEEDVPVFNSLADDLADIYRDIKSGLSLYDEGYLSGAAWEWRFNFFDHWGWHLVGAQRAIFHWISENRWS